MQGNAVWVVFANVLLQQLGLPVPAVPTLLAAGSLAMSFGEAGQLLAAAILASVFADLLWYVAGRAFGYRVLSGLCKLSLNPGSCPIPIRLDTQVPAGAVLRAEGRARLRSEGRRHQVVHTRCALGTFPRGRVNPNGGSIALGHPFGAPGARILSQTVKELSTRAPGQRAIVSICADGGQGSIVLLEAAQFSAFRVVPLPAPLPYCRYCNMNDDRPGSACAGPVACFIQRLFQCAKWAIES